MISLFLLTKLQISGSLCFYLSIASFSFSVIKKMTLASKENIPHVVLHCRHVSVTFAQSLGEHFRDR